MASNTVFQGHGPMQFHSLHMYLLVYFPFLVAIKPNKYILILPVYFYCLFVQYGGCEGPDAMYVKLVSSDGHEFIVKRDHALTSGTINAMLSGPGQFAENETNEINFREIP